MQDPPGVGGILSRKVFNEIKDLITEQFNPRSKALDHLSIRQILHLINQEDQTVPHIIAREIPYIEKAIKLYVDALRNGGRVFYVGAGTSGRLGVLDAAECPPTFGTDPKQVQGVIAGGWRTLIRSREGVEDDPESGASDLHRKKLTEKDLVMGITASKRTPYVLGALNYARKIGAKTVFVCANPRSMVKVKADVHICLVVGPEVIAGSTRLKAGTAQKLVLNMISTTAMVCLGKVFGNVMVDLKTTSQKLAERSKRILMLLGKASYPRAEKLLQESGGSVKVALTVLLTGLSCAEAEKQLAKNNGFIYKVLKTATPQGGRGKKRSGRLEAVSKTYVSDSKKG